MDSWSERWVEGLGNVNKRKLPQVDFRYSPFANTPAHTHSALHGQQKCMKYMDTSDGVMVCGWICKCVGKIYVYVRLCGLFDLCANLWIFFAHRFIEIY